MNQLVVRVDFESSHIQPAECLRVPVEIRTAAFEQDVGEKIHAPFRRNIRIQLADRSRSEIAGVRECRQPVLFAFLVDSLERCGGHQQLATHFKVNRNARFLQTLFRDR